MLEVTKNSTADTKAGTTQFYCVSSTWKVLCYSFRPTPLATSRRKIDVSGIEVNGLRQNKTRRGSGGPELAEVKSPYRTDCFSIVRPMLMTLSAMTPSPTQRFIPASPL